MTWWLVQNAVMAVFVALPVAALCRLGRFRPAVQHALWLLVLLKLATPPLVAWPWSPATWWHQSTPEGHDTFEVAAVAKPSGPMVTEPCPEQELALESGRTSVETPAPPAIEQPRNVIIEPSTPPSAEQPTTVPPLAAATDWTLIGILSAVGVWAFGCVGMALVHIIRFCRFHRLLRFARSAPPSLQRVVHALARQMNVSPPLALIAPGIRSPMIWAVGRPRLLWPADWQKEAHAEVCHAVIIHELAHLRRRDHWVRWLEVAAGCIWWWHPVFWWTRSHLHLLADWACDAWVVDALPASRRAYAEVLIQVSAQFLPAAAPAPALGIGDARRAFQRRLTMIMSGRIPCRAPRWSLAAIALLGLASIPVWSLGQTPEIQRETELRLQVERLRAELEKTRAELQNTRNEAAVYRDLKALEERRATQARDDAKFEYRAQLEKAHASWTKQAEIARAEGRAALAAHTAEKRPWSPEQATGAPDTPEAGDFQTAWASRTEDDQDEWLQLQYQQPVTPVAILVFETFNPGAVSRITVSGQGTPAITWEVKDPTPVGSAKGVSIFAVPSTVQFKVSTVRLQIDSRRVPGWNEIDAVGLLDESGRIQWAASAIASSFFGEEQATTETAKSLSRVAPGLSVPAATAETTRRTPNNDRRIDRLEQDMAEMKAMLKEMQSMMRKEPAAKNAPGR